MNVFLLEVHPSLCLVSAVYHGLVQAHNDLCELHRATGVTDKLTLRQKLLQLALQSWNSLASPGDSYSSQIQKDVGLFFLMHTYELIYLKKTEFWFLFLHFKLFSDVFFDDPILVQKVGLSLVRSAEEKDMKQGKEKQSYAVETFSKLLELITIRHRLLESASETAHLAQ